MLSGQLGSPAATSLNVAATAINNPVTSVAENALSAVSSPVGLAVVGVAAGVTLTAVGVKIIYDKFKAYEEKKHLKEIEAVNRLYKAFLEKISIPNRKEISVSFPPIFRFTTDEKKSTNVESMHFTADQVERIGMNPPSGTDIALIPYQELIKTAIFKLKEYFLSRDPKKHNDVTSGVLCYLLNMLETRCQNFQGYDYDIAYIGALCQFIDEYASLDDDRNSVNFTRLTGVSSVLGQAREMLINHQKSLSLEEMMGELREASQKYSESLLRSLVKITVPVSDRALVDTASLLELESGFLRGKYTAKEFLGLPISHYQIVNLPNSPFKRWIINLATYLRKTLDPNTELSETDVAPPDKTFTYPNLERLRQLKANKKRSEDENQELKIIEKTIESLEKEFENCMSFLTYEIDPKSKKGELAKHVPIKDEDKLISRTKLLANFSTLIQELISLQYLCLNIIKSIKQLGEIYTKNPLHLKRVFNTFAALCSEISDRAEANRVAIAKIKNLVGSDWLAKQKKVVTEIEEQLDSTKAIITGLGNRIKDYRDKALININNDEPTKASVRHGLFNVGNLIISLFDLKIGNRPLKLEPRLKDTKSEKKDKKEKKEHHHRHSSKSNYMKDPAITTPSPLPSPRPARETPVVEQRVDPLVFQTRIDLSIQEITRRIGQIKASEATLENEVTDYLQIQACLHDMSTKSAAMSAEQNKSLERMEKANKTIKLTLDLCKATQDFLALERNERIVQAEQFSQHMHALLAVEKTPFIDKHNSETKQSINDWLGKSFFSTDSRVRAMHLDQACERIALLLGGDVRSENKMVV